MATTFIHTADWQLGKPYAGIDDADKRAKLRDVRYQTVADLAKLIEHTGARFVLVAGDLFDSVAPTKAEVAKACAAIGSLPVPVYAIPGNHDHGGPGSLWEQPFFVAEQQRQAPNLRVLLRPEPVEVEGAVLFPCPLLRKHESEDLLAWLPGAVAADTQRWGSAPRLVLAHGSVQGFGAVEEEGGAGTNDLNLQRLGAADAALFDYVALGDWHGTKQVGPRAWYSGTPEVDRFPKGELNRPGNVLVVEASRGALPVVREVESTLVRWHELEFDFHDDGQLAALDAEIQRRTQGRVAGDLLKLHLAGHLGLVGRARLDELLGTWQARLLRLKLADAVALRPTDDEVAGLANRAADPLVSAVAKDLLARLRVEAEREVAQQALRELYLLLGGS